MKGSRRRKKKGGLFRTRKRKGSVWNGDSIKKQKKKSRVRSSVWSFQEPSAEKERRSRTLRVGGGEVSAERMKRRTEEPWRANNRLRGRIGGGMGEGVTKNGGAISAGGRRVCGGERNGQLGEGSVIRWTGSSELSIDSQL